MAVTVIKNYGRRIYAARKSKTGLVIGISLILATGVGLYIWHRHKKKKEELEKKKLAEGGGQTQEGSGQQMVGGTEASLHPKTPGVETTIGSSTNPITVVSSQPKSILSFQKWANSTKGAQLVEDGIYGPKTKAVWNAYGAEYQKIENMKMQDYTSYKGNPIGKTVYSKYAGADIFDGNTLDSAFNKVATTTKSQALGKVAKVIPTNTGSFVVFSGGSGKFYKMHSANLNIFA